MATYSSIDPAKTLDAADRVLQIDPNNFRALTFETYFRKAAADALTNPDPKALAAAKQPGLDAAASFAQRGLTAPKPAGMSDADFKKLQDTAFPIFYGAIGYAALNKNDSPTAIDAYKKELAYVPLAATQTPGPVLQDTYYLAVAYYQSTPPDLLNCTFYASRVVAYAPAAMQPNYAALAKYCYKKYHGKDDGYDAVMTAAKANLNPPADFATSITPAPTPADIVADIIKTTPDLATLAVSDKEYILQNGKPEDAAKAWDTIKGKSSQFPDVLVIEASPTVIKVAVSDDAVQNKTADFTFNMATPDDTGKKTPAATAAAKKRADAIAAITPGAKVTLSGTYDFFTPSPIMIVMKDGDLVLPKAAATKPAAHTAAHAPVHHATH